MEGRVGEGRGMGRPPGAVLIAVRLRRETEPDEDRVFVRRQESAEIRTASESARAPGGDDRTASVRFTAKLR
jgi:hypothetical protein